MKKYCLILTVFLFPFLLTAQTQSILVPQPVSGAPFVLQDQQDLFGQSYRWFLEGNYVRAVDSLRTLITKSGYTLDNNAYYMVVANFSDSMSPIGILHGEDDFFSNRFYGLDKDNLFYIFISRQREGKSFLSVLATEKASPFLENLPLFIGLFQPLPFSAQALARDSLTTYVDVRRFNVPKAFRKFSDLSVIVKSDLAEDKILAKTVFDNTSREHMSYGIATALTSVDDVDFIVGGNGNIIVRPKPGLDPAVFAVLNYHFKAIDSRQTTFGNSLHLLGGLRLIDFLEPIVGIGGGFDMGNFALHLFAGYSVEFANTLKSGEVIGETAKAKDPFKLKLRGKPRFGIEIKFP